MFWLSHRVPVFFCVFIIALLLLIFPISYLHFVFTVCLFSQYCESTRLSLLPFYLSIFFLPFPSFLFHWYPDIAKIRKMCFTDNELEKKTRNRKYRFHCWMLVSFWPIAVAASKRWKCNVALHTHIQMNRKRDKTISCMVNSPLHISSIPITYKHAQSDCRKKKWRERTENFFFYELWNGSMHAQLVQILKFYFVAFFINAILDFFFLKAMKKGIYQISRGI